jgi:hypothetical protein
VNPSSVDGNIELNNLQTDIYDAVKISITGKEENSTGEEKNGWLASYNFSRHEDPDYPHWYEVEKIESSTTPE